MHVRVIEMDGEFIPQKKSFLWGWTFFYTSEGQFGTPIKKAVVFDNKHDAINYCFKVTSSNGEPTPYKVIFEFEG